MKTHCAMEACIEGIRCGCLEAIEVMKKRGEAAAADQPYTPGSGGVREEDIAYFKACVDVLVGHLTRIASVGHYRHKRQLGLANKVYFDSLEVRICAVLRAVYKKRKKKKKQKKRTSEKFLPPNLIIQLASELSVWEPLVERVLALWIRKDRGGFRLICAPDPKRRAQQIILRDVILMLGIDNEFDYTRKGAGGERAFRDEVIKNLCGGYGHWWTPDVRDCFGSLKPGHFSWLPLDRRLMRNVVYLPRCAEIEVKRPEDPGAVLQYLKKAYPDLLVDESLTPYEAVVHLTQHLVRQGLPLGSCLSPLLARAFVARELRQGLDDLDVRKLCWIDDINIAAHSFVDLQKAQVVVTERLLAHPAGPIVLHNDALQNANKGKLRALGLDFLPGRGYKGSPVHVIPGKKRTNRFKQRLEDRLKAAVSDADPFELGEGYALGWFGGQTGWTKVPVHSLDVCRSITTTYVADWQSQIPMGGYNNISEHK